MGKAEHFSFCFSTAREEWDPADQSYERITMNKLDGECQHLGNKDEKEKLSKKQEWLLMTNNHQLTAPCNRVHRRFIQGWEAHLVINCWDASCFSVIGSSCVCAYHIRCTSLDSRCCFPLLTYGRWVASQGAGGNLSYTHKYRASASFLCILPSN